MKNKLFLILCLVFAAALMGCGDTQTSATKEEQANWENPVKEPPPEAGGPPTGAPSQSAPTGPPPGAQALPGGS